jgi:hypothetical protein
MEAIVRSKDFFDGYKREGTDTVRYDMMRHMKDGRHAARLCSTLIYLPLTSRHVRFLSLTAHKSLSVTPTLD